MGENNQIVYKSTRSSELKSKIIQLFFKNTEYTSHLQRSRQFVANHYTFSTKE